MKRNTRKSGTTRKRKGHSYYNTKKSKGKNKIRKYIIRFLIKLGLFIGILVALYNLLPDVIQLQQYIFINKDELQEMITDTVHKELGKDNNEEINEESNEQEIAMQEESEIKPVAKAEVTSRGSTIRNDTKVNKLTGYRVTSYHPGDGCASTNKTGSGKSTSDFDTMKIGNKNVYTYKGRIVVAAWSEELYNTGYNVKGAQSCTDYKFHYGQEIKLIINGATYNAIVLDSCGAAGWNDRGPIIDIFVPSVSDCINSSNVQVII